MNWLTDGFKELVNRYPLAALGAFVLMFLLILLQRVWRLYAEIVDWRDARRKRLRDEKEEAQKKADDKQKADAVQRKLAQMWNEAKQKRADDEALKLRQAQGIPFRPPELNRQTTGAADAVTNPNDQADGESAAASGTPPEGDG